jgi:hypothetical protein
VVQYHLNLLLLLYHADFPIFVLALGGQEYPYCVGLSTKKMKKKKGENMKFGGIHVKDTRKQQ